MSDPTIFLWGGLAAAIVLGALAAALGTREDAPTSDPEAPTPAEIVLLKEIRELKRRNALEGGGK